MCFEIEKKKSEIDTGNFLCSDSCIKYGAHSWKAILIFPDGKSCSTTEIKERYLNKGEAQTPV